MDRIDVYIIEKNKLKINYNLGLLADFKQRPIQFSTHLFPIDVGENLTTVYLRIATKGTKVFESRIWTKKRFDEHRQFTFSLWTGYMAVYITFFNYELGSQLSWVSGCLFVLIAILNTAYCAKAGWKPSWVLLFTWTFLFAAIIYLTALFFGNVKFTKFAQY